MAAFLMAGVVGQASAQPHSTQPTIVDLQVGFAGEYKLGLWAPAQVTVEDAAGLRIEVVAPDSDGVGVQYSVPANSTAGRQTIQLLLRVGRRDAALRVRLISDAGSNDGAAETNRHRVVAEATFSPEGHSQREGLRSGLPSTDMLFAELGASSQGLVESAIEETRSKQTSVALCRSVRDLPRRWMGYEPLECLWINLGDRQIASDLMSDEARVTALSDWVQGGGRLVIAAGGEAAETLKEPGPLTALLPGKFSEVINLNDGAPLESYAGSSKPIAAGGQVTLPVAKFQFPKLENYTGRIEAYAGSKRTDLPLVVRRRIGFGEITLVTFDPTSKPLADWPGLSGFVARAIGLEGGGSGSSGSGRGAQLVTTGYNDLSGAVQHNLGASFVGVSTVSMFAIVATLLAYLVLIGPIDYFFLKQGLGRMEITWVTFPLIVFLFGGGAYWLSGKLRGAAPQLNRLELVDVDGQTGLARSVMWAQAFSPQGRRYDLRCEPYWADGSPLPATDGYLSWLGMPGRGLGGLDTSATSFSPLGAEYRQLSSPADLQGVPINTGSTKALLSRWYGSTDKQVESDLTQSASGLPEGTLINGTGSELQNAWLVAGDWAWRLGRLPPGAAVSIDASRPPITLKTIIRRDFLRKNQADRPGGQAMSLSDYDLDALAALTMFTTALGGSEYTQLENQFLPFTDLSDVFKWDQAVLVAQVASTAGSQILSDDQPYAEASPKSRVYYRFVLPINSGQ